MGTIANGGLWLAGFGLLLVSCSPGAPEPPTEEAPTRAVADQPLTPPDLMAERAEPDAPDLSNPDCLSYGQWRTTLTSDGPDYPLPRFAPAVERRCAVAFPDNRQDVITILAAGARPERTGKPAVLGGLPNAGGLRWYDEGVPDGEIEIRASVSLGGQANADAIRAREWDKPVVGKAYPEGPKVSWRGISIAGALPRADLLAAINSLEGRWAPVHADVKGNDRLDGMKVAARWDRLSNGRHFLAEVGAPDLGVVRDKPRIANYVQLEKTGDRVVAMVYHWESDFLSCYRGKLDGGGRLTNAQFVDAGPDPGVRKKVEGLGTIWPDHLVNRPLRPASQRVRRDQKEGSWKVGRCRELFAGEQDPPPTPL